MIKQTWDVSNEEKNRILNLHETATKNLYIIKEQIQSSNIIDFGSVFPSGQYQLSSNFSNEVSKKVQDLVGFIKGKNLKDVTIDIQSGESNVTNQAPFQEPGSLALARANSLKTYLDRALPNLLGFTPKVVVQNPIMGTTPYTPGDNKDDPRYTKEQFVRAVINTLAVQDWQRKSSVGEPIYLNNRVIAIIEKPFVDSKSCTEIVVKVGSSFLGWLPESFILSFLIISSLLLISDSPPLENDFKGLSIIGVAKLEAANLCFFEI
jgi:hypothetical protein